MSKNTRQGRFGLVMIVVLSIVMNLLTGCGMKAKESERTNYLSPVAEAQEIGYSETATSTASASSPTGKKSTPSTTTASTAGTGSSVCYYNWELQGDGNDGYGSNDWNFGKSVFVEGMTAEQAMSAFQEHLYRDPVMAAATIAGIAEEMHLTDVQLDEQSIQVQINRINAAAQHYNSDHTYWYADCNTVMQHLNNLEQSVEAIGAYHSACYQTYRGTNAIPEVKVCTSSHTGGHALVFRGKNIELRFRLECGFQLVDVLVVSAPETIPDEPEETTTTTTTTTAVTTQPEETTTTTTTVVDVKINKVDVAGEEVPGAELTLTGKDTNGNPIVFAIGQLEPGNGVEVKQNSGDKLVWISGTSPTNVTKLVDGSYVLHEEAAPNGYKVANDIPFTVVNGKASSDIINMVDEREETTTTTTTSTSTVTTTTTTSTSTSTTTSTETTTTTTTTTVVDVKINKVDVAGEEVPGAVLTLTGKDPYGELIVFSADQLEPGEGVVVKQNSGDKLVWISGTSPTNVTGLIDGSYILHEEAAPNGYKVANDIPFTVVYGKASSDIINMIDEREETTTTTTETTSTSTETTTTSTSTSTETTTTSTETTTTTTETTTTKETTTTATTTLEPKNTTQAVPVETDPDNGGTATEPANTTPSDEPVWPSSAKNAKNPVPNVNDTKPVKEEPQATPELAVPVLVTASPNDEESIIAEDEAVVQTMDDESAVTNDSGETIEDSAGTDSGPEVVELELGPDGCMYDANTGELVGIPIPAWIG